VADEGGMFKLFRSTLEATGLNKADLSKATTKLEGARYIKVFRKPGHKNSFTLTEQGREGLVERE
jgi:DNA-binding MarR family transcriptional regulator